ncbi:MAG: ankyrin repeat domain-containing protein [Planctomycetes bacterium]|nr:ankyrin repeat domain-containing protein [Planctomycetota bacterium]
MRTFGATTALSVLILLGGCLVASAPRDTTAPAAPSKPRYFSTALLHDIEKGNLEAVKRYLAGGADINTFDGNGMTLLHQAASDGQKEIVLYLLDHGANINARRPDDGAPIHCAAVQGHTETVRLLAERGAAVFDAPTAVAANNVERLRQLVKEDSKLLVKTWYTWAWSEEHTLLHHAAHHGSVESLAALVALGADPKAQDSDGRTPLMIAAAGGHVEAVRELLKHDERINLTCKYGWTPLVFAASREREAVVRLLLERGADYDLLTAVARGDLARVKALVEGRPDLVKEEEARDHSPLTWAAVHNHPEVLTWLIDHGADINYHNNYEGSVLSVAAWEGHIDIAGILLDRGANIELGAGEDAYGTPLHRACWQGNLELVRLLLDRGAQINSENNGHETPLCFAVGEGRIDVVRYLLDRGADPNKGGPVAGAALENRIEIAQLLLGRGAEVGKAIHYAADRGYLGLVELLLKYKIDRSLRDDENRTPLHLAVLWFRDEARLDEYCKIVDLLLEHGYTLEDSSSGGRRVIHLAGNLAMLEHLLNRGADVNTRTTSNGVTLLHQACASKDVDRVKFLLEHGADVHAADNDGARPIHFLLQEKSDERSKAIAALLRERGAALDVFAQAQLGQTEKVLAMLDEKPDLVRARGRGGQTLLHIAAGRGDLELVKALLSRGADLELKDRWAGWTPLHCAAGAGHTQVVAHLIKQGAKVEAAGVYNQGILYTAAMQGHAEVVRLLLAAGADVEATTVWEHFPLVEAAGEGHREVVKALLDAGARINRTCKGSTALDEAVGGGHEAMVIFLLERGADLNASRDTYSPPLHDAASGGWVRIIKALLKAGEDVNCLNDRGDTALDWALSNGRTDAVKALREAGGMQGHELTGPERVAPLIRQLGDDSCKVCEAAEAALRGIAPRIAKTLRDALRETDDPECQVRLRRILASLPPDPSGGR